MAEKIYTGSMSCSCGSNEYRKVRQLLTTAKKVIKITNAKCIKCGRESFQSKIVIGNAIKLSLKDNSENERR